MSRCCARHLKRKHWPSIQTYSGTLVGASGYQCTKCGASISDVRVNFRKRWTGETNRAAAIRILREDAAQ
jgi:hypothetical protein